MTATVKRKPTPEELVILRARLASMDAVVSIPLHRRDGTIRAHALVDEIDVALSQYNWYLTGPDRKPYVTRTVPQVNGIRQPQQKLHRVIMGLSPGDGLEVDHVNGDQLDCRRENLRVVSAGKNQQNRPSVRGSSSRYRGVSWSKRTRRWRARVTVDGCVHQLGDYRDEDEAGRVASEFREQMMDFTNEDRACRL